MMEYLRPVSKEKLTAKEYLEKIATHNQNNIKRVSFLPSKLGSGEFGSFMVEYKHPKLVTHVA